MSAYLLALVADLDHAPTLLERVALDASIVVPVAAMVAIVRNLRRLPTECE